MLKTSSTTHAAAAHSNTTTARSPEMTRRRADAIQALPSPMPKMNAIKTTAKDCRDEPKISTSDRDESTSKPIDTPPVNATINPDQRKRGERVEVKGESSGSVSYTHLTLPTK